jgi:hypothetical protein
MKGSHGDTEVDGGTEELFLAEGTKGTEKKGQNRGTRNLGTSEPPNGFWE